MPDDPDFAAIPPADGYDTLDKFMAEVARLAALPEHEYERARKDEAANLGVRVGMLDQAVKKARPRDQEDEGKAGRRIVLPSIEPWPDPVGGAELLAALVGQLGRFVVASDAALVAAALWIVHTHAFEAWWISPKFLVKSATKRCGKTRVFEVMERLVARRLLISLSTCSSVFRVIEAQGDAPPTLLMDEADKLTRANDDMRKLINAGQSKSTASVMLNVPCGDGWEPRQFSTWAPIALAGIGDQADTIQDRAVTVRMKRKTRARAVEKLRGNRDYGFNELARKCVRWAVDHVEALKDAEPLMPELLHDRAQDNWEPLIAIADAAGGEWPDRARKAALLLQQAAEEMDEDEVGVQLLHDIDAVFELEGGDRITTAVLLIRLHDMEERLWATYGRSETRLTGHQLGALLRQFDVRSRQMKFKIEGEMVNRQGYEKSQFIHLLAQYPKQSPTPLPSAATLGVSCEQLIYGEDPVLTAKVADCLEGRGVGDGNGDSGGKGMFLGRERICWWCGEPLLTFSRSDRQYCSDACRQAAHAATESVSQISRALEAQGVTPARPGSVVGNGAAAFEPTDAWQDVPDGAICPPGLHYQIDPNTGLRQARKPQAPDDLICAAPDCAATFQRPPGRGRTPKFCPAHRRPRA